MPWRAVRIAGDIDLHTHRHLVACADLVVVTLARVTGIVVCICYASTLISRRRTPKAMWLWRRRFSCLADMRSTLSASSLGPHTDPASPATVMLGSICASLSLASILAQSHVWTDQVGASGAARCLPAMQASRARRHACGFNTLP
jgi:hypothetical protein